jgi:CDP-glycerol glycerophosphotransferase (TagB/SpsB family)
LPISKISLKSFFKFFLKIFIKNLDIYESKFIEKELGLKTIWYANNLDRNIKYFPINKWEKIFDIYLTSLKIERALIKKKFPIKKIYNIGFPKLDRKISEALNKKRIINEFKLNAKRKIIVYLPTLSRQRITIVKDNISKLEKLSSNFNLIVRPHPKEQDLNKEKFSLFKRSKLKLDLKDGRNTGELISASDLIITDGGSTILEAIYLKKKLLIHNWQDKEDTKCLHQRLIDKNRLDVLIRKNLPSKKSLNNINYIKKILINKSPLKKIKKIRFKYFDDNNKVLAEKIIKKNFKYEKLLE